MNLAFVSSMASVPWGGSEVLWHDAARVLLQRGHRVSVAYPKWPEPPAVLSRLSADTQVDLWYYPLMPGRLERALKLFPGVLARSLSGKMHWLKSRNPDLLCISSGNAIEGQSWMEAAMAAGCPYVTLAQAHVEFLWPTDVQAETLRRLFAGAKRNFFVSQGNRRLLETQLGERLEHAEVVANHGCGLIGPALPWPQPQDGVWRLACVGRLHPQSKGQDLVIEVLAQEHWRQRNVAVTLFGAGPNELNIRRLVASHGVTGAVIFGGHVLDVRTIWETHHALLLPSRYEGRPLAIVEAFLCGRPAIVTDVAGNAEVVEHGVSGFVAEAPTAPLLDKAMEEAWAQRENWQAMGSAARDWAESSLPLHPGGAFADQILDIGKQ
jgi:glycosyltransferase involved in cell wall biosynthesis